MAKSNHALRCSFLATFALFNQSSWSESTSVNSIFNGIYGGLGFGTSRSTAKINSTDSATVTTQFSPEKLTISKSFEDKEKNRNIPAMISIGAGKLINNTKFYLGAEGFISYEHTDTYSLNTPNYNTAESLSFYFPSSVKITQNDFTYSGDLKLGYLMYKNTLAYLRVGASFIQTKLSSANSLTYSDFNSSPPEYTYSFLNSSKSKTLPGLRLGIGGEQALTENFHLNLDVIYTNYQSLKVKKSSDTISTQNFDGIHNVINQNGFTSSINASGIRTYALLLGIKYYIT